jgi:hypothetical protein
MDLVKKNLVSIIFGAVAILAVVAIFWPISGFYSRLNADVAKRKTVFQSIKSLDKKRPLPQLELASSAEAKQLDAFPTKQVIDAWQYASDKLKDESAAIQKAAVQMNAHPLLVPNSLPLGTVDLRFKFIEQYKSDLLLTGANANRANSMPARVARAGFVPTEADVTKRKTEVQADFILKNGDPASDASLRAELDRQLNDVRDKMCKSISETCGVYVDTTAMDTYQPIIQLAADKAPDPGSIFIAQLGYWIQKDVLDSIAAANKDAKNVTESPVKRLIKIKFPGNAFQKMSVQAAPGQPGAAPPADTGTWPQPNKSISITGRDSNGVYDVIRFDVQLFADAAQVPRVLQELSRGKFITVLNCGMQSVDSGSFYATKGYYFCDPPDRPGKPIVQLDLSCEALLLREWTRELMPPGIKQALGVVDPPKAQ